MPFEPWNWLARHPAVASMLGAGCVWVSIWLIVRMWRVHRRESFANKLVWTFFLLVPLFGWVFYAGFFQVPELHEHPSETGSGSSSQWLG